MSFRPLTRFLIINMKKGKRGVTRLEFPSPYEVPNYKFLANLIIAITNIVGFRPLTRFLIINDLKACVKRIIVLVSVPLRGS